MSTFLDFAIGLSLVNGISGQIQNIITDFKKLDGVTDEMMGKLSQFKNISITGGLLAGAGIAGLMATKDVLVDCISEAEKLQSVSTTLEIKAFGKDLLDETKLPQIKEQMDDLKDNAMDISLNTVFNAQQVEESMISMIKGGMSKEMVAGGGAEANAYFAQINGVDAKATADATVKFASGFQLQEDQIKDSLNLITSYADASIADALAIQQNIGNTAGTAMNVWKGRNNMDVAEDTIRLVAATKLATGDEATAATMTRNFLDEAGKTIDTMTDTQVEMMTKAGWLQGDQSVFIDYNTGMLKSAEELEMILEDTAQSMSAVDFNNLVDIVFGDRGKRTASELAKQGSGSDLKTLKANAEGKLGIDDQVAKQMETAAAQAGVFEESLNTLKATLGEPFLEGKAAILKTLNEGLADTTKYFRSHPEITKFMVAIAAGASSFLLLVGTIMLLVGLFGSLKLILSVAGPQIIAVFAPVLGVLGVVIAVVAVIAGLAFVIYRNWSTLKPQFEALFSSISRLLKIVGNAFKSFGEMVIPVLFSIWNKFESVALWIINIAVPLISGGLNFIANILTGDFRNAWESMGPLGRILTLVLGPSIIFVTGQLMRMASVALVDTATTLASAAAKRVAAGAVALWKGMVAGAVLIQKVWTLATQGATVATLAQTLATKGGVAATIAQKIATAALYPVMLLVRGAALAWTVAQVALSAAMKANPIGFVIILIAALIGVIILIVTHFKDLVKWVQKGWDKLKSFLGFKKDAKVELEEPIELNIKEKKEKEVSHTTHQKVHYEYGSGYGVESDTLLGQNGMQGLTIPLQPVIQPKAVLSTISDVMKMIPGLETASVPMKVAADVVINKESQDVLNFIEQGSDVPLNVDYSQLNGMPDYMKTIGSDGVNQLASEIGGADALGKIGASIDSVNNSITGNLIKDEQMQIYGSNLIQSFINGMNSKTEALRVAVATMANIIDGYLGVHSPTKVGPLHTNQYWGGNLVQSFIRGMYDKHTQLDTAVALTAEKISGIEHRKKETLMPFANINHRQEKEQDKNKAPIYIVIQSDGKNEKEIAQAVAKELERRGLGNRKVGIDAALTKSRFGYQMGY